MKVDLIRTLIILCRLAWCVKVMSRSGNEILGVQSARNSMLASTLLASSVLVVAFEVVREFYLAVCQHGGTSPLSNV